MSSVKFPLGETPTVCIQSIQRAEEPDKGTPRHVIGPLGERLSLEMLPPPSTTRWVTRRKAEVVVAVEGGLLTLEHACERYNLSLEEFVSWQRAMDRAGLRGLRTTRFQFYRSEWERKGC